MRFLFAFLFFICGSVWAKEINNPNNLPLCSSEVWYKEWNDCHAHLDLGGGLTISADFVDGLPVNKSSELIVPKIYTELHKFKEYGPIEIGIMNFEGAGIFVDFADFVIYGDSRKFNLVLNFKDTHPYRLTKNFSLNSFDYELSVDCKQRKVSVSKFSGYVDAMAKGPAVWKQDLPNEQITETEMKKILTEGEDTYQSRQILLAMSTVFDSVCTPDISQKVQISQSQRQQLVEDRRRLEEEKNQQQTNNRVNKKNDMLVKTADSRRRFALVIGNANYTNLPKLINAVNDVRLISKSLRSAGFQVSAHENLDLSGMQNAIRSFGDQLGKDDVGLVYFAGHGVQVKGKNYLIPVKENIKKSFEVPSNAIDVDLLISTLENVKNDLNIVILDSCRSSFPGETRGTTRGLATIEAAKGTFIAFATAPGKEALDGSGSNSPYTKHLSRILGQKGLPLELVFKEVRKAVVAETNGEQVPWENSSLMGDFYFVK